MTEQLILCELTDVQFKYTDTAYGRLSSFILDDTLILVPSTQAIHDLIKQTVNISAINEASPVKKVLLVPAPAEEAKGRPGDDDKFD